MPQFHAIPENDQAWGEGFTEWNNVRKATPLFEGHYQPKIPLHENYYCLLNEGVMERQATLAKQYGVYGFCYYHYWFKNGRKLLEKPLERMLQNPNVDIPFCLCWANENWTKRWDGGDNEIIVEQDYDDMENLDNHVDYLCDFFRDSRYIKENGKPIFLLYRPELIPELDGYVGHLRKRIRENGFPGVKLIAQYPLFFLEGASLELFDAYIQFQPLFYWEQKNQKNRRKKAVKAFLRKLALLKTVEKLWRKWKPGVLSKFNYDEVWEAILDYNVVDTRLIAGAFTDWDNTARRATGALFEGATPQKFGMYMGELFQKVKNEYQEPYIFINAWNEWGEGAYLEPDQKYGYAYLEELQKAIFS